MDTETAAPETSAPEIVADAGISAPRKRGRPPGSKNRKPGEPGALPETPLGAAPPASAPRGRPRKVAQIDSTLLARQIQGLHLVAARATGLPELELQETESMLLAEAIASVSREYGLALDGKTGAVLQLLGACAIIYMPRLAHVTARRKAARAQSEAIKHDVAESTPAH